VARRSPSSVVRAAIGAAVNPTGDPAVMPVGTVGPVIGRPVVGSVIAAVMGTAIAATIGPPIGHSRSPICDVGVGLILTDRDGHSAAVLTRERRAAKAAAATAAQ